MTRLSALAVLFAAACTTGEPAAPGSSDDGETAETAETTKNPAPTETAPGATSGDASAAAPAGMRADCPASDEGGPAPTSPAALQTWLRTRAYACWTRESVVHRSTGPHGGNVRTYLNAALDRSMKAGSDAHPVGAVSVKELFGSGNETVTGWAVGVKTSAASDGGKGWYWYEVFDTTSAPSSMIEGQGKSLCSGCHAAGQDFVLVPYPLR